MTVTILDRFRIRRGTAADLATVNEVPLADELVYESDQGLSDGKYKIKIGNGTTHYNDLPYLNASVNTSWGAIIGTLSDQLDL